MAEALAGVPDFEKASDGLRHFNDQLKNLARQAQEHAIAVQRMAASFSLAIKGMVASGFAGTQEANRLGLAWTLLSRQIASLFIPVVNVLTSAMMYLASVFSGLSGYGQSMAVTFMAVATAIATKLPLLTILGTVFSLIGTILSPMTIMLTALAQGLMDFLQGTIEGQMIMAAISEVVSFFAAGLKLLGPVIAAVADAVTVALQYLIRGFTWVVIKIAWLVEQILDWIPGLGDAAESVKRFRENAQANLDKMNAGPDGASKKVTERKRNDVTPANARFEELGAAFERVTMAGAKMGADPAEARHNDQMKKQDDLISAVGGVREAVEKKPGAIGR